MTKYAPDPAEDIDLRCFKLARAPTSTVCRSCHQLRRAVTGCASRSFDHVVLNTTRAGKLQSDPDVQFVLYVRSQASLPQDMGRVQTVQYHTRGLFLYLLACLHGDCTFLVLAVLIFPQCAVLRGTVL